jgi:3'-5' exoribonuclease
VGDKVRALPQFPATLRALVEHMILSHHGKLEYGSPKVPQFPEAMMLHYLDDLDSKMECMRDLIASDRQVEGCFTAYNGPLERAVLKKDLFLNPPAPSQESVPAAVPNSAPAAAVAPKSPSDTAPPVHNGKPKPESAFGDKLRQALQPARSEGD